MDQIEASVKRLHEDGGPEEVLSHHAADAVQSGDPGRVRDYVHGCNSHIHGVGPAGDESNPKPARYCHYLDIIGDLHLV